LTAIGIRALQRPQIGVKPAATFSSSAIGRAAGRAPDQSRLGHGGLLRPFGLIHEPGPIDPP
jgi:hypothetical protein